MEKSKGSPVFVRFCLAAISAFLVAGLATTVAWSADPRQPVTDGDEAVVAEEVAQSVEPATPMIISDREPWNEAVGVAEVSDEAQMVVPPTPLGPAPDGTFSVFVHLDPRLDRANRANGAASAVRLGVRNFAQRENAQIQYEYDILPNVLNVRGVTARGVAALKLLPGVVKVEEDSVAHTYHNDSMPLIRAYQSQLQAAGFTGVDGAGVRICVIDTGIDSNSIMYSTRIDAAAGWDFVNNDSNPEDDNGHGSHCSGTALGGFVNADFACATTGPESMQGVAPAATLIGVKVLNAAGSGSFSNVIAGINRCASTSLPGGQADVISLSLGGGAFSTACDSDTTAIAVNNAFNAGVVVVVAAGNEANTNAVGTPACASGAITVAAIYDDNFPNCDFPSQSSFVFSNCTDTNPVVNQRCCFSNRSSLLEVTAPGCIIFSDDSTVAAGNGLVGFCGTSQATPHVAGLAALLLDANPSLTPTQVRNYINAGAVDLGAAGFDNNFGWGRIDAINSLQLAAPAACTTDAQCSDGLFCNGAETCIIATGVCQAGTAPNCADAVACTTDTCNEGTDSCDHTPNNAACSDGLFCNGSETCNATLGCQAGTDPCPGLTCDETGDFCIGGAEVWMSFVAATTVPVVGTVDNEDIVARNVSTGAWRLVFDGSDVGLSGFVIDGMSRLSDGSILLSFTANGSVAGMTGGPSGTTLDDSDIVRFIPTSLGASTAGSFVFYFDGSDVGLTANDEDIDAIGLTSTGQLVISTLGSVTATGASGADTDLLLFNATSLGSATAGSFSVYFDGSDVSLTDNGNEDVDAAAILSSGNILISTTGNVSVPGVSGANEDILQFTPTTLGSTTSGTYAMYLDLSTQGIATGADVGSVDYVAAP